MRDIIFLSGHRMTDLLLKLKNKIVYNIKQAVDEPDANLYAEQRSKDEQQQQEQKEKEEQEKKEQQDSTDKGDPDKLSVSRIFSKVTDIFKSFGASYVPIILSVIIASIIANEMIIYATPIRVIFFIFTIFLCMTFTPAVFVSVIYYVFKYCYHLYIIKYTEKDKQPKVPIFPTLYAFLPITTYRVPSDTNVIIAFLINIVLYPFRYGNTKNELTSLIDKMEEYSTQLEKSFSYYKQIIVEEPTIFESPTKKTKINDDEILDSLIQIHGLDKLVEASKKEEEEKEQKEQKEQKESPKLFAPGPANSVNSVNEKPKLFAPGPTNSVNSVNKQNNTQTETETVNKQNNTETEKPKLFAPGPTNSVNEKPVNKQNNTETETVNTETVNKQNNTETE